MPCPLCVAVIDHIGDLKQRMLLHRRRSTAHAIVAISSLLSAAGPQAACAFSVSSPGDDAGGGRRSFLAKAVVAPVSIMISPTLTNALDMDAFASSQLTADTPKKELSDDEALCKFGAPGKQRGEACQRAGIKTGKSDKNKVDVFGNIDRGDFVRCNREWRVVDGKYQKFDICK